jgi:hypothetical protein
MRARIDIPVGTRFGKLRVLGEGKPVKYGRQPPARTMRCQCECGAVVDVTVRRLRSQGQQSCSHACAKTVHGMARREGRDPLYNYWRAIRARTQHEPWHDPAVFCQWVLDNLGPKPGRGYTIERLDANGDYEPGNVAWLLLTPAHQGEAICA